MPRLSAGSPRLGVLSSRLAGTAGSEAERLRQRDRDHAWRGWYKTARWQRLRRAVLKRDGFRCQATGELLIGKYPAANSPVVDHVRPHRGDPALFWDEANLQAVSKGYHDSTKQRLEAQGRW